MIMTTEFYITTPLHFQDSCPFFSKHAFCERTRTDLAVYRVLSCVVLVAHIDVNMLHVIRKLYPVVVFPEAGVVPIFNPLANYYPS